MDSASTASTQKEIAVVLSTMRSGSTLLKALLAAAPDISNLPETNFQKYQSSKAASEIGALSDKRIVVLKRPSWFHDAKRYPKLPNVGRVKRVILVRDATANILSLRKMAFRKAEPFIPKFTDRWLARYWHNTYRSLQDKFPNPNPLNFWIRYEDIVANPIESTAKLYEFLGSEKTEGIDSYPRPSGYEWKWGTDDGGPNIKTLKVQAPRNKSAKAIDLENRLANVEWVQQLRAELGYS